MVEVCGVGLEGSRDARDLMACAPRLSALYTLHVTRTARMTHFTNSHTHTHTHTLLHTHTHTHTLLHTHTYARARLCEPFQTSGNKLMGVRLRCFSGNVEEHKTERTDLPGWEITLRTLFSEERLVSV